MADSPRIDAVSSLRHSESLDHEVRRFGIRVVVVEPGVSRTLFEKSRTRADRPPAPYAEDRERSEKLMREWVAAGDAPQIVADAVVKAATDAKPLLRDSAASSRPGCVAAARPARAHR